MMTSIWESDVVNSFENESSGGKGWICYTEIAFGYKVFAKGRTNEETFFPFDIAKEGDKERAMSEAEAFRQEYNNSGGSAKPPTNALSIVVDKDNVHGYDNSQWQGNRIIHTPCWTDAYKLVIRPSLKETGADLGWQWLRLGWKPDPKNPERENTLTGEMQANLVPYIMETFASKQEALDAAAADATGESAPATQAQSGKNGSGGADEHIPEGYDTASWAIVKPDILKAKASGISNKQIADDYGITIPDVVKVQ